MFFSITTQGFYVGDDYDKDQMPSDCIEVSTDVESQIRSNIMAGSNIVSIIAGKITTAVAPTDDDTSAK